MLVLALIVFAVIFVVAIVAAYQVFDDLETALIPALVVSGLGSGVITVGLSQADRTLIVACVVIIALAIVAAAYILARSRRR